MGKDRKKDVNEDVIYGSSSSSSADEVRSGASGALETSIAAGAPAPEQMSTDLADLEKRMVDTMASKKDLADLEKRMASKKDLADLEKRMVDTMASKADLADLEKRMVDTMASKKDLADLEKRMEKRMATKEDLARLEGEIKRMATDASVANLRGQMLWVLIVNTTMMAALLAVVFAYVFGGGA